MKVILRIVAEFVAASNILFWDRVTATTVAITVATIIINITMTHIATFDRLFNPCLLWNSTNLNKQQVFYVENNF